jgi:cilia- and flagella-associated protein 57
LLLLFIKHQLVERLQVIESKEETCKAARDEQINLENFRYMLDQKIKMLQNEKTQILAKIAEKEKNLKNMFNELIKEANQNEHKYQDYKRQNVELKILEESVKKSDLSVFLNSNILNSYRSVFIFEFS